MTLHRSPISATVLSTPVGPLSILVDECLERTAARLPSSQQVIIAAGYTAHPEQLHTRLAPDQRPRPLRRNGNLGHITEALARYHGGEPTALDDLVVDQPGTPHQQAVWRALRAIPPGTRATYTEIAAMVGRPRAVRAVGAACARNLVAPIVPCHRAVRRDGGLGGYYYGLDVKRWLLELEARSAASTVTRAAAAQSST